MDTYLLQFWHSSDSTHYKVFYTVLYASDFAGGVDVGDNQFEPSTSNFGIRTKNSRSLLFTVDMSKIVCLAVVLDV